MGALWERSIFNALLLSPNKALKQARPCITKDLKPRDLPALALKASQISASVLLVIGATGVLSWLLTAEMVAMQLSEWIRSVAIQPLAVLLLLNIVLLLLGIFIEPLPAMLLTAPPFLPMAQAMHIDLMLMGVIMVMNLSIALYTRPVGGTLFVAAKLCKASIYPPIATWMPSLIN